VRNGNIERARVGREQRCPSPLRRISPAFKVIGVGVFLLKDANSTLTAGDVDTLIFWVIEDVISIP